MESVLQAWNSETDTWADIHHKDVVSGTLVRIYFEDEVPAESHEAMAITDAVGNEEDGWFFEAGDV
jgi:hypothetical protein